MEIRLAKLDETKAIQEFFKRNYGKSHSLAMNKNLFLWQFQTNDHYKENDKQLDILIALHDNRIVGALGLIFNKFRFTNTVLEGVWLCNLVVDEEARKFGTGIFLMSFVQKLQVDIIATIGINEEIFYIYQKNNFHTVDNIERFITVLNPVAFEAITHRKLLKIKRKHPLKPSLAFSGTSLLSTLSGNVFTSEFCSKRITLV